MALKVAAVQFCPQFKEKEFNLRRMEALGMKAGANGAKLIVFPELSTTGYAFMSPAEARPYADKAVINGDPANSFHVMARIAAKYDCAVVWGFVEVDAGTGSLYNSQAFLEKRKDGWYFETYAKINPWANDYLWAGRGTANPPVIHSEVTGNRVGLLICRDVRDKKDDDWSNFYSKGDADIVAFSANWGVGGFPSGAWVDFVSDHAVTLIVANRYGEEGSMPNRFGGGGTCIITPKHTPERPYGVHCDGLSWNKDCIVYAELP